MPLVLANLTFASWIKFHNLQEVAIIMSAMLGVGIMLFGVMQGHWFSYIAGPSTMLKAQRVSIVLRLPDNHWILFGWAEAQVIAAYVLVLFSASIGLKVAG